MIGSDPRFQSIISAYRAGEFDAPYQAMDYTPSPYYNPIYDIRREQIKAGELEEGARFPIPLVDTKPKEEEQEEEQFDPCPPGYQLIDGVCQPDSMFQPSGGDSGERTEFESPYLGDIYLPMANDPINTELRRFAAQSEYQPTFGSSMQDLGRTLMQFSPVVGLLNAVGLGPSYTETVEPRESIQNVIAQQQAEANLLAQQAAEAERLRQLDIQRKAEAAAQVEKLRQQQAIAAELERQRQANIAAETERMRLAQQQAVEAERRRQLDIQRKQEAAAQQAAAEAARQAAAKQAAQEAFRKAQQSSSSRDRNRRTPSRTYAPSSGTTTGRTVRSTTGMLGGGV